MPLCAGRLAKNVIVNPIISKSPRNKVEKYLKFIHSSLAKDKQTILLFIQSACGHEIKKLIKKKTKNLQAKDNEEKNDLTFSV